MVGASQPGWRSSGWIYAFIWQGSMRCARGRMQAKRLISESSVMSHGQLCMRGGGTHSDHIRSALALASVCILRQAKGAVVDRLEARLRCCLAEG